MVKLRPARMDDDQGPCVAVHRLPAMPQSGIEVDGVAFLEQHLLAIDEEAHPAADHEDELLALVFEEDLVAQDLGKREQERLHVLPGEPMGKALVVVAELDWPRMTVWRSFERITLYLGREPLPAPASSSRSATLASSAVQILERDAMGGTFFEFSIFER